MRRAGKVVFALLAALGALQLAVAFTPSLEWYSRFLTGPAWDDPRGDVLVVLGAEGENAGTMGYSTYWRCHTATRAWRAGQYRRVIVSGGDGLAQSMADFLAAHGVPPASIILEPKAETTAENARFVAKLVKEGGFRQPDLVTSDFHMRRASAAFRKVGLQPRCIPAPDMAKRIGSWPDRWSGFLGMIQETAKLGWYRARGLV